jgi:aminomethyltransferase
VKQTPLYELHRELGGKIIDFGGWALPVQYAGIIQEHEAVRNAAGLFDVSHMGEIEVFGPTAESFVQKLVTGNVAKLKEGQVLYSLMCYEDGGVVDDLLVYKYTPEHFLLVVNASNSDKDFAWVKEHTPAGLTVINRSPDYAQLAIQGPKAEQILQKLTPYALGDIAFFYFVPQVEVAGQPCLVSRTGYTGEDGFEIYCGPAEAQVVWRELLRVGAADGLEPVGLGARDTLRFEANLPLYGHELSPEITPLEAGLSFFVKLGKGDFMGREALVRQKAEGVPRKPVGFVMRDRGVARPDYEVVSEGRRIGHVTSGSYSPTLKQNLGIALIEAGAAAELTEIGILVRGKELKAEVVPLPFYQKRYRK